MKNAPRIAIIGGGPGGLVLARHLQRHGLAATIFELDAHPLARPQGGSLDLHAESGLRALRELGLEHEFLAVARYDDQGGAIYDVAGVCHHVDDGTNDDGTPGERPEIDRTQLRALLLASLDDGTVVWDSKVRRVVADGDRWRVQGTNSGGGDIDLGTFDLVVGADGAWSKVRPLLSAAQPDYLGLLCYELMIDDVDNLHSDVAALLPHGKVTVVAEGRGLIAQRSSNGHVRVYVMLRVADDVVDAHHLERLPPAETRAQLVQVLGLSSSVSCLVTAANDTITRRPIVALPVGHRWDHRRGLTLVGDAAHVMSPFSGEGVNMAMLDGLELGLAITSALSSSTSSSSSLDAAIAEAEARLFVRAADAAAGANAAASTWPAQTLQFIAEGAAARHGLYDDVVRTPQHVFDTQFAAQTQDAATRAKVQGRVCFELTGPTGGAWIVDYGEDSAGVRRGAGAAHCTVRMSDADFLLMTSGGLSPRRAFMTKRLQIAGDVGLAFTISEVLVG